MTLGAQLALVALLAPAVSAVVLVVVPWLRLKGWPAAAVTIAGTLASLAASLWLALFRDADVRLVTPWVMAAGRTMAEVGVQVDSVAAPMLVIVTVVALMVQVFSVSYLHDEPPPAYGRYFAFHALFLFAMNCLVVAPNLLQLFAGWELVGLASYLLIGFWFAKPSAARAAVKAFWMTKLGDMGFLFGLLWLFTASGTFDWTAQVSTVAATGVTLLLFFAVMGKSAQFPLHVWLPDAMEGPTPVSALLHAATMVAAGVYLLVRADPLFAAAPLTRDVMIWVGATTAVFAAGLALVQTDLKKVLAFSTCSQLGYMVTALGAGGTFAGFFHLGTHAFFKALLFLAAGSVIHAVHSNEMSSMGGLARKMPLTTAAFTIGALSLAGVPGFAGFFSKDLVLHTLEGRFAWVPWVMLMGAAFLTAFYMGRVLWKAFFGPASHAAHHAHEGPAWLWGPLVVLMVPAVVAGFLGRWLAEGLHVEYEVHLLSLTPVVATTMGLSGLAAAWMVFSRGGTAPLAAVLERLDKASLVDRFWEACYRKALLGLGGAIGWFDRYVIDGVMNGVAYASLEIGSRLRRLQTGLTRDYAFAVALGLTLLVLWGDLEMSVLSVIVAAPTVAAVILLFLKNEQKLAVRFVSFLGALVSMVGAVLVAGRYDRSVGGLQLLETYPLVPSLGIHLKLAVDGWGVALLLLTGIIISTGVLASWSVNRRDKEFFFLLLVLVSGVFGVFVSQDLFVFFLFYEIAVLPMYLLIGIWGSSHQVPPAGPFAFVWKRFQVGGREYAAMKLTLMLLIGSAAIMVALIILWNGAGARTFDLQVLEQMKLSRAAQMWVFPLVWLGFGSLAGVFPFHTWSPDGHASAPTAVSMLHAGVLMKLGAFGVMRIGFVLAPDAAAVFAPVVGAVAVVNVLYGALSAASQTDLKYVIAYSSVSHMGVVMLGAATMTVGGWNGAVYQMVAHGIMTGLFFAMVGLVYERSHTRTIARMGGFAHTMPAVGAFFTLACLSSLGLPGTAGFVAEFLVFAGAAQSRFAWWVVPGVLGAFVTAVYVLRAVKNIFWGPPPSGEFAHLEDAKDTEYFAPLVLGAALVVFGFWPRLLLDFIDLTSTAWLRHLPMLALGVVP